MNAKKFLADFGLTFVITFVAAVLVTFLWNLIVHGTGSELVIDGGYTAR